jgi:hypothetical protein
MMLAVLAGREADRPDGHVESCLAAGANAPDGPAIGPARIAFDLADQFHRPNLGRARDRSAGKQGPDHVDRDHTRQEFRADGRNHLVHGGIAFDRERLVDLNAAGDRDAREVVAHEVDDHQVLGLVLQRVGQFGGEGAVFGLAAPPRPRALHGLDLRLAVLEREEQLGAEREQPVIAVENQPSIAGPSRRTDRPVYRQRIAARRAGQAKGKVRLVDVARPDSLLQGIECLDIGAWRNLRFKRPDRSEAFGGTGRQPFRHVRCGDGGRVVEQSEPDQRAVAAGSLLGKRHEPGFERQPGLVSDVTGQRAAVHGSRGFRFIEDPGDVLGTAGDEHVARALEQVRVDRAFAAGIVEQDERFAGRHRAALACDAAMSIA